MLRPAVAADHTSTPSPFYVIGDVHGCADELNGLLERLPLTPETLVLMVGDYIDRGPDARKVLEVVLSLAQRCRLVPLLGNHEAMFLSFLNDPTSAQAVTFVYNGGGATLASYADQEGAYAIPTEHLGFLHELNLWYETPDYFVVHAGVPDMPLDALDPARDWEELIWTRNMRESTYRWSKLVVHGHTATRTVLFAPNHINVDTACVFNNRLSAIELPSGRVFSVKRGRGQAPRLLSENNSRRSAVRFRGSARVRLFIEGAAYEFETVNYSQTGMLVRWLGLGREPAFRTDQMLGGLVGAESTAALAFTAVMVRHESRPEGLFFGIRLLPPHGSTEISHLARGLIEADEIEEAAQWAELIKGPPPDEPDDR